jgi:hypothetical protein
MGMVMMSVCWLQPHGSLSSCPDLVGFVHGQIATGTIPNGWPAQL